jgi:hypothetical protein
MPPEIADRPTYFGRLSRIAHNRYVGITSPKDAFAELRPLRQRIIAMQGRVRPFGPDYLILDAVKKALDTAAYHFTSEPDFFSLKPEQSRVFAKIVPPKNATGEPKPSSKLK